MAVNGSVVGLLGSLVVARFLASANLSMHLSSSVLLAGITLLLITWGWLLLGFQLVAPDALTRSLALHAE